MFKSIGWWKLLAAPVAVPLALTLVVALAGPGGVLEPNHPPAQSAASHGIAQGEDATGAEEAAAGSTAEAVSAGIGAESAPQGAPADGAGCVEALTETAASRPELEEHVADAANPDGGADGNQNALDKQCHGAFASETGGAEPSAAETPQGEPPAASAPADPGPPADAGQENGGNGDANGNANGSANGQDGAGGPKDKDGQ